jgi:uncharacterized protein YidB (DUF937 family)
MAGLNMNSAGIALLGLLAVKGFQHRDELGKMLGGALGGTGAGGQQSAGGLGGLGGLLGGGQQGDGGLGGMLGGLGGLLGGDSGSTRPGTVVNQGLGGLLDRFRQNGDGDVADSWVKSGPNQTVDAQRLERALGPDVIEHLQTQTGLSRDELLQRLSHNLPQTVDQLTPEGRLPTDDEADGFAGYRAR